jgi:hypothetical protein
MKIFDERGNPVGEIDRPEPLESGGKWWEAVEYRSPKLNEPFFSEPRQQAIVRDWESCPPIKRWITREIPRATPEQLKVRGMRERDGRPVQCVSNDRIWIGGYVGIAGPEYAGTWQFVLEPAPPEKPVETMICPKAATCKFYMPEGFHCNPHKKEAICKIEGVTCPKCVPFVEPTETPAPKPPPPQDGGYEYFSDGREIENGDEFQNWTLTVHNPGDKSDKGLLYRRRRKAAAPPALNLLVDLPQTCPKCGLRVWRKIACGNCAHEWFETPKQGEVK